MTAATIMPNASVLPIMRPVASTADSLLASELLTAFISDDPSKLDELVPGGETFNAVAVAEDGSAAEFEVFSGDAWDVQETSVPLARLVLRRPIAPAMAA